MEHTYRLLEDLSMSLNPFLVRVGVGTLAKAHRELDNEVLIPSWLGWVLEQTQRKALPA